MGYTKPYPHPLTQNLINSHLLPSTLSQSHTLSSTPTYPHSLPSTFTYSHPLAPNPTHSYPPLPTLTLSYPLPPLPSTPTHFQSFLIYSHSFSAHSHSLPLMFNPLLLILSPLPPMCSLSHSFSVRIQIVSPNPTHHLPFQPYLVPVFYVPIILCSENAFKRKKVLLLFMIIRKKFFFTLLHKMGWVPEMSSECWRFENMSIYNKRQGK